MSENYLRSRKRAHSDDAAPPVAKKPKSSTQDGTCLTRKRKRSSSRPSQCKRRRREDMEDTEKEEKQSAVVETSGWSSSDSSTSVSGKSQGQSSGWSSSESFSSVCSESQGRSLKRDGAPGESQIDQWAIEDDYLLKEELERKYKKLHCLGEGGYGSVYAASRREDGLPVAIKYIPKWKVMYQTVTLNREITTFPLEAALMKRVDYNEGATSQTQQASVALLEMYELSDELVLVMERPEPSMDLFEYIRHKGGKVHEEEAKEIFRQLVEALHTIHAKGVFHRDIKPKNILIQTIPESLKIWVLDFGCGCFTNEEPFIKYCGTFNDSPPEWHVLGSYQAEPCTVWQIGIVLYYMLCGRSPFNNFRSIVIKRPFISEKLKLSQECKDMLRSCLDKNPNKRSSLSSLLEHPWLTRF